MRSSPSPWTTRRGRSRGSGAPTSGPSCCASHGWRAPSACCSRFQGSRGTTSTASTSARRRSSRRGRSSSCAGRGRSARRTGTSTSTSSSASCSPTASSAAACGSATARPTRSARCGRPCSAASSASASARRRWCDPQAPARHGRHARPAPALPRQRLRAGHAGARVPVRLPRRARHVVGRAAQPRRGRRVLRRVSRPRRADEDPAPHALARQRSRARRSVAASRRGARGDPGRRRDRLGVLPVHRPGRDLRGASGGDPPVPGRRCRGRRDLPRVVRRAVHAARRPREHLPRAARDPGP